MTALCSNTQYPSAKNAILMPVIAQNTFSSILQCARTHTPATTSNYTLKLTRFSQ